MFRLLNVRNLLAAALLAGILLTAEAASASDWAPPRCTWQTVVSYRTVERPVVHWVTRYSDCGRAYRVRVVTTEYIEVPVTRRVKVCY